MSGGLTQQQARALAFLRDFSVTRGYAPSLTEIGAHIGLKSRGAVSQIVNRLEERGHVRRAGRGARNLEIIMPRNVTLNYEVFVLAADYANKHQIKLETAVNEALRQFLGAVQ